MAEVSQTTSAATDVPEFLSDLDGGIFERKLSIAMSQVAAAVVDNDRAGSVSIAFSIKQRMALKARNVRKFRNSNR